MHFERLFSKHDANDASGTTLTEEERAEAEYRYELWRAKDEACLNTTIEARDFGNYGFGLAGLGSHKPLHALPGSWRTWRMAFKALKDAEVVYTIGFSLSPYDTMARFHIGALMRQRET